MVDLGVLGATRASWKALAAAAAFGVAGCGVTTPLQRTPVSAGVAETEIVTGSIPLKASPTLSPRLDQEDWRRARAALATALDPQGNGGVVRWENGESGRKGSFAPVGNAYLVGDDICRSFVASLTLGEPEQWLQGGACRISPAEWAIKDVKGWKRPE